MRIAIVHEFLTQLGGGERVLQNFLEIWPKATLHILIYNEKKIGKLFNQYPKKISFLNKFPLAGKDHKWLLPLMPWATESFNFDSYDLVLTSGSSFAKGVKTGKALSICYCHTPTRFLWTEKDDYLDSQPYPFFVKTLASFVLRFLKKWDYKASQRPNFFIANSENVKNRIKKYYNRESEVIFPPVDARMFYPDGKKENYFFTASRLEPYKKIDLAIEAFNQLGWPLKVAGSGTNSEKLRKMSKANIEFVGRPTDEELRKLYSQAQAFVFPAEEDAGIMVLESQACGTPVIAFGKGGSLETVIPGQTGEFFYEQTPEAIIKVLQVFRTEKYNSQTLRENALKYDKKVFQEKIKKFVEERFNEFKSQA